MKIGSFEFGDYNIDRFNQVEMWCIEVRKKFPDRLINPIKYIQVMIYVNCSIDLINDHSDGDSIVIRDGLVPKINDIEMLDYIDEIMHKGL